MGREEGCRWCALNDLEEGTCYQCHDARTAMKVKHDKTSEAFWRPTCQRVDGFWMKDELHECFCRCFISLPPDARASISLSEPSRSAIHHASNRPMIIDVATRPCLTPEHATPMKHIPTHSLRAMHRFLLVLRCLTATIPTFYFRGKPLWQKWAKWLWAHIRGVANGIGASAVTK